MAKKLYEPPIPQNERQRQQSLETLQMLDTPAEERFDRITRLASNVLNTPVSTITLIDNDRQWFKSAVGLQINETPRVLSFCGHTINDSKPMIVQNTLEDKRFAEHPLVKGPPFLRFYAGQSLTAPDGNYVGTLCVFDFLPKKLKGNEIAVLQDLASIAESELRIVKLSKIQTNLVNELDIANRKAAIDPLTQAWNRGAIFEIIKRELSQSLRNHSPVCILMADIDLFKSINDSYGHQKGDFVLKFIVSKMRMVMRAFDSVGRYGGEEFLIVLSECNKELGKEIAERINREILQNPYENPDTKIPVTISIGISSNEATLNMSVEELIAQADKALYNAKNNGRNRVEVFKS